MIFERSVGVTRAKDFFAVWSWTFGTGMHELSLPPQSLATPEPTPQASPSFESSR
jgi:hypothetical protein